MATQHLQREAPAPLHVQLKSRLLADITTRRYQAHQRLPSERELSEKYKVSRMTVRQALLDLAREGAIYTRVGKGTFVSEEKIDQQLRALTGFTHDVQSRGGIASSKVLEIKVVTATPDIAAALRISPDDEIIVLARLRLSDKIPLAVETAHLPFKIFPNLLKHNFAKESLYDVLEREYKITLTYAEQSIEASLATRNEIELLKLKAPAAVLKMRRLTFSKDGTIIEYVMASYRGDRYKFRSTLQPKGGVQ
jgi:GntR family transcriptional regulator